MFHRKYRFNRTDTEQYRHRYRTEVRYRFRFSEQTGTDTGTAEPYTAPIILPRPTNPWALQLPTPLPCGTPHGRPRGPVWPPATCPHPVRHLRLTWARTALPCGLACRVASARVPRATSGPCHVSSVRHVSFAGHVE